MREIDVAVFAFDEDRRLRLINRAGERLLAASAERLLGQTAADLHLAMCLEGPPQSTLQAAFPGGAGRFGVRRTRIREKGLPLDLVVISDLTQALSEQELQAWQRLVRVLGHELNNSLTPIKSIAGSLESILSRDPLPEDWRDDMRRGLNVITVPFRQPQPLHRRLRPPGQTAAPAAAAARPWRSALAAPPGSKRASPSRWSPARP